MTNRYHNLEAFHRTVNAMLADPDLTGDLLLCGIWLARATILKEPDRTANGNWNTHQLAADLFGDDSNPNLHTVRRAFETDLPRYDPLIEAGHRGAVPLPCAAPMIRRATCEAPTRHVQLIRDPATGRHSWLAACNRHRTWQNEQLLRNREAVRAAGDSVPIPLMNAGGALARHVHGIKWTTWWTRLDPKWTPPADGTPAATAKPTLSLMSFEPCEDTEPVTSGRSPRPALTVLEGGWS